MASFENKSIPVRNSSTPVPKSSIPPVFNPPRPQIRNGGSETFDQSSKSSRTLTSFINLGTEDVYSKEKLSGRGQNFKATNVFNPYHHSNNHQQVFQPPERREGGPTSSDDPRLDGRQQYYNYPRDGPSPGRGYSHKYAAFSSENTRQQPSQQMYYTSQMEHASHQQNQMTSLPVMRASHDNRKRKVDPTSPEGPRLISNQSSDDSISALLPPKRARSNNGFSEPASLMRSFTPLSPIHSRTFSRDEAIDMSRFIETRGSDNLRIFQSWSSGNSPPNIDQSSLDVRLCYNDWQGNGRRASNSRIWPADEKLPSIKERDHDVNDPNSSASSTTAMIQSKGNASPSEGRWWSAPVPRQPSFGIGSYGEKEFSSKVSYNSYGTYNTIEKSQHCQPLHPEDRFTPFSDHLLRRLPAHSRASEARYWQGQRHNQQDLAFRHRNPVAMKDKFHRAQPIANGWDRYEGYIQNTPIYDKHSVTSRPPQYEVWSDNRPYHEMPISSTRPCTKPLPNDYVGRHLQSAIVEAGADGNATAMKTANGILLLSLPEDKISLSETLCIVRENIEVFIATEADVKAPAPGRKRPVVIGQVGLRCIHCRSATHQSEKVKRAVCFPSSIKRIYRTVIDMKLDHFKACRFVPIDLKMKLEQLKATNARSTGTTMQYFVSAAKRMGMVDGSHGIRLCKEKHDSAESIVKDEAAENNMIQNDGIHNNDQEPKQPTQVFQQLQDNVKERSLEVMPSGVSFSLSLDMSMSGASSCSTSKVSNGSISNQCSLNDDIPTFEGKTILACPEDRSALSPLRCFLRENVYAFSATVEDIAVRTPTTFSVVVGQVGIGCIHCHHLPAKERSNRAVCFPFSIGRIYQAVADIQRFHLSECKMIPPKVREKFLDLQRASTKGSKGLATRQYWISSAKKLGLVDTSNGIRFGRDPCAPIEKAKSLDILAQVATDATAVSKPLVVPEDESQIAGFIYLVMKQLQPCRFTEADRNKRRLKDVGCIGVECKHCAGQVDGRKFFWSSVSAVESNFVSVHTHMMECKAIPNELKEELAHLKTLRKEHTSRLKTGSQKAFFARVWERLHADDARSNSPNQLHNTPTPNIEVTSVDVPFFKGSVRSAKHPSIQSPCNSFSDYAVDIARHTSHGNFADIRAMSYSSTTMNLPKLPSSLTNLSCETDHVSPPGSQGDESSLREEAKGGTFV
mmetsp:Transcript_1661/g.3033  ORF Transcript_1661/g.3033 Transcript_1661/m.3033 type:complete len:1191 (-) Transcript_1661:3341-6913(-)|eukprot:CAMPEP_0176486126 /NCGR_PEP_ID=MMETSP0200_2-20121128/5404_1 /TAXON_ID=947934 /ORGANISM="Chaetoceros sp., Strain GSL56" /LENGTH=1190 /DNA_ID=CAMNT_0017882811 /DNA_START=199 /DNA_END=3771 /DNA_ORIENTATION=+